MSVNSSIYRNGKFLELLAKACFYGKMHMSNDAIDAADMINHFEEVLAEMPRKYLKALQLEIEKYVNGAADHRKELDNKGLESMLPENQG